MYESDIDKITWLRRKRLDALSKAAKDSNDDQRTQAQKDTDEFATGIIALAIIPAIAFCLIPIMWTIFSLTMPDAYTGPPSIGHCTFDGSIIRCEQDLGGEPHHYVHHEYKVLEVDK